MATNLPMTSQMEQIHGEINDNFRALSNGFQRLDKIKDSNRQSKQLEELTGRMRECKRLIKEFESEIKDEATRNPPEVTKQLNDEKQSMVKELNSYVALRKTYMSTNKRVELFDTGAGASEPMPEDNARMASAMSNQELVDAGMKTMDETDQAIERSKKVVQQTVEVGTQTAVTLKGQVSMISTDPCFFFFQSFPPVLAKSVFFIPACFARLSKWNELLTSWTQFSFQLRRPRSW
ncbi:unnamed protein product [Linum tenue]|uniref:Uncharacterized protein n=1 Tax=Linum tenue TaxID=586396 RepID=A0AAV0LFV0_9ROSI|nr:unnamed protein product [Linum tenue]